MRNILNLYKESESFVEMFAVFEREIIKAIESTIETGDYIVIKESLFTRLVERNPNIKNLERVLRYKRKRSEALGVKATSYISKEVLQFLKRVLKYSDNFVRYESKKSLPVYVLKNTCVTDLEWVYHEADHEDPSNKQRIDGIIYDYDYDIGLFGDLFKITGNRFSYISLLEFKGVADYITKENIYVLPDELIEMYTAIDDCGRISTHVGAVMKANLSFESKINEFLCGYLMNDNEPIQFVLGGLLDVAELKDVELEKFISGYYTSIPYFDNGSLPEIILQITEFELSTYSRFKHILIKDKTRLLHIVYEDMRLNKVIKFDEYDLKDREEFNILSYQFVASPDCLSDVEIDLMSMLLFDEVESIKVYKDISYNHDALMNLAMNCSYKNGFTDYMQDRAGLYHRWKR
ncbi:hypothetical protein E6W26_29110 [Pseudomonas aeruginosa]|uniref:hypothetical protein n=1 Tax=Pseudomonas aeruginosa TaxID=287 RepID=UPI00109E1A6E|nr:hypothetical protein [Pseudomonas aeruginosa]EKV1241265.1 hypothetical protein [Pseudomonas aeruginosa]EKV8586174.1 hypothetical protein [Pseudomonas aeruginosa]ELN5407392.1 hypothetical protein [Pseudomonas aeruginosa]ELP1438583.1 hypothetical protein [Pseudomonas aeruginosa]THB16459.1 hypothetical protein E6W26_29110 [Pseudomonas aeruginosa]